MLTIYRASAGAGKTHKLTGEYLELLFSKPDAYRHILAVTFTNKATDEMKSRIIHEFSRLADGHSSDYIKPLREKYGLTEEQVRLSAEKILVSILHDYAAFNISTIDRFFQQTMRAFTREIGLQGGYGIEMDQELVLGEAVDRLLIDLEKPENKELLGWLLRFAEEKIEDGGEWNLRRDMLTLGAEVFKEKYKAFSERVAEDIKDKRALNEYREELSRIIRSVENTAKELGNTALRLMDKQGLSPADFKGGSRSPFLVFVRLAAGDMKSPSATFTNLTDNPDVWTTKTTPAAIRESIGIAYEEGLNECVRSVNELFSNLTAYYTANEIVRYYYTLGILTDISRQIAAWREDKNRMLITDTTELLNKVIDGSDVPFIYEKTGTSVEHYMIDEFQDTSEMQWHNFRPLIHESLAYRRSNLIVGDVKQSIYRFRNSDWMLLDEKVRNDFQEEETNEETLKENWRSCRQIVAFNNSLFHIAPALLQETYNQTLEVSSLDNDQCKRYEARIVSAYQKSVQQVAAPFRKKDGHVQITFLADAEEQTWKEQVLSRLPSVLEQLQADGYPLRDIAILVRTNREGAAVAETLLAYKEEHPEALYQYEIISDDALFVSASPSVRFLVDVLRFLNKPDDRTAGQRMGITYALLMKRNSGRGNTVFPEELKRALLELSRSSLYEITEGIYQLFESCFQEDGQVFVQAFMDMVAEYAGKETADLNSFLQWWEESGSRKTIATPDTQNAIRILTIHKSKGLGFKALILPFCEWRIDHAPTKSEILWCSPEVAPFNRLSLVPVRYGQKLADTYFAEDYFKERLHAFMDNLNTLYVAFTRAKEELIVFAPRPKKADESGGMVPVDSVSTLLWNCLQTSDTLTGEEFIADLPEAFDAEAGFFELSAWWSPELKNAPTETEEFPMSRLVSIPLDDRLRLRLHPRGGFFDNESLQHGLLMHDLLSTISRSEEVTPAVERCYREGAINRKEADDLIRRLSEIVQKPAVVKWFDGSYRVLNEVNILFGNGHSRRPDRVMIADNRVIVVDYKFGGQKDRRYHRQLKRYLQLIREMGFSAIEGYLWYVELDEIERVDEL